MKVRFNNASLFLGAFATLALSGCQVGPKYQAPQMPAPPAWGLEPADAATKTYGGTVDSTWWNSFHDAELTSLVTRLAKENLDLKSAAERVEQARDARQIARAAGLPSLNANASYTRVRQSPNGFLSLVTPAPGAPFDYNFFADSVSSSWDLDLFGRVRRSVEAAEANTRAAIEAKHGIALAAISELAQDYMQLRGVQAREAILEDNLKLAEENLRLVQDRFNNGVSTTLDVANAQAQRASIAALIPPVEAYKAGLINAIGMLLQPMIFGWDATYLPRWCYGPDEFFLHVSHDSFLSIVTRTRVFYDKVFGLLESVDLQPKAGHESRTRRFCRA